MNTRMSKDEQLIIELTRRENELDKESVYELVSHLGKEQWKTFMEKVTFNKVLTIVASNIEYLKEVFHLSVCPEYVWEELKEKRAKSVSMVEILSVERRRLAKKLKENDVKAVFLKGETYSEYLGYKKDYRFYKDLDILVLEEDLWKLHEVLTSAGYKVKEQSLSEVCDKGLEKKFAREAYGVMEYEMATSDNEVLRIDTHKANRYNIYNSLHIYNNAVCKNDIYQTSLEDLLIYACFHAFHHYGLDVAYVKFSNMPKLKNYVEIRDVLIYIIKSNQLGKLTQRIKETEAQFVVNEMIKLVELLYDEKFVCIPGVTDRESLIEHHGVDGYETCFEHRLFRKKEEQEKLRVYAEKMNEVSAEKEKIYCLRMESNAWSDEKAWEKYQTYQSKRDDFWVGYYNVFGFSKYNYRGVNSSINMAYDLSYFYIKWDMRDKDYVLGETKEYDSIQSQLIINIKWAQEDFTLYVQPKENGEGKIFIDKNKGVLSIEEINDHAIKMIKVNDGFSAFARIPWEHLGVNIGKNRMLNICMNVNIYNRKFEDCCLLRIPKIEGGVCEFV